jgi:hypothetical protein
MYWIVQAVAPPLYVHPTTCMVLHWLIRQHKLGHAIIVCSITIWTMIEIVTHYFAPN